MDISNAVHQTDWTETDPTSPSYLKHKPGFASHTEYGFMSKEDKVKLDGIDLTDYIKCDDVADCIYANREDVLDALGYEEIEIAMRDTNGRLVSRTILAKVDGSM